MPSGGGSSRAEDAGHDQTDRAGHPVTVAEEGTFVRDEGRAGVVAQGAGEGDSRSGIGAFEGKIEGGQRVGAVVGFESLGHGFDLGGVTRFVGKVVEAAAESVKPGRGGAAFGREKFTGEVEAFSSTREEFFRGAHAARRRRFSTTLAELKTPGMPAPGWVPAPTK